MKSTAKTSAITIVKMTDSRFLTAIKKGKILHAWGRFLRGGLKDGSFTDALYEHLIKHCGFVAHFDRDGFYAHYFSEPNARTLLFLDQFDPNGTGLGAETGDARWMRVNSPAADLNQGMRQVAGQHVSRLREKIIFQIRARELALATEIFRRHEHDPTRAVKLLRRLVACVQEEAPPRLAQDSDYIDRPGLDGALKAAKAFLRDANEIPKEKS